MNYFLDTTNELISWFEGHGEVNEVGFGDANEFDTSTITDFPYVFIIPSSLNPKGATTTFIYQILVTDVLNEGTPKIALNRTADIVIDFFKAKGIDVEVEYNLGQNDVIYDARGNRVYGWSFDYEVTVKTIKEC